jgi:hypothetical protein
MSVHMTTESGDILVLRRVLQSKYPQRYYSLYLGSLAAKRDSPERQFRLRKVPSGLPRQQLASSSRNPRPLPPSSARPHLAAKPASSTHELNRFDQSL